MDNLSKNVTNESKEKKFEEQISRVDKPEYISEIEKLYHKIKEDWL